jgi:SNF2 family DNA or RNA helicase
MYALSVTLSPNDKVRLQLASPAPEALWESIVDWWSEDRTRDIKAGFIDIDVTFFSQRRIWLRENWTNLGYAVNLDDGVRDALNGVDSLISKFNEIASRGHAATPTPAIDAIDVLRPLTDFQMRNVECLINMPHGANFSVPGAGKTFTTLAVWEFFRKKGEVQQLLVICPRSAFEAWELDSKCLSRKPEISQFTDTPISPSVELLYLNFEQLENDQRLSRLIKWVRSRPSMMVIDEAHRIKAGRTSVRWRACFELAVHSKRVDLLTGTPMPQSQEDLRNLLSLSWRGIPREFFSDSRLRELRRGGVYVRTTKSELQLPPLRISSVLLPMSTIQREVYSALKQSFIGQFALSATDSTFFGAKGKAVMTLIAAATNPGLLMRSVREDAYLGLTWPPRALSGRESLMSVLQSYASHEIPEKYQWIAKFVAQAVRERRKVLIWSTFIANLLALRHLLAPHNPALVYGGSAPEDRVRELNKFRTSNDCFVLLSNPQTLGEGISLHNECHDSIYLDRSYNAGLYLQSLDRIHRLGLPASQETNVFLLQCEGSIDQRISRRLEDKIQRLSDYMNDEGLAKASLPDFEDASTTADVFGLEEVDLDDIYKHLKEDD